MSLLWLERVDSVGVSLSHVCCCTCHNYLIPGNSIFRKANTKFPNLEAERLGRHKVQFVHEKCYRGNVWMQGVKLLFFLFFSAYSYFSYFSAISSNFSYFLGILYLTCISFQWFLYRFFGSFGITK